MSETIDNFYMMSDDRFFVKGKNMYTHIIFEYVNPGLHNHSFIEFFYVLSGKCNHYLNGETYAISSGDACLLTPNDKHQYIECGTPFIHRDIIFKLDYFKNICNLYSNNLYDKLMNNKFNKRLKLTNNQLTELEALIQSIEDKSKDDTDMLTCYICTYILNAYLENNIPKKTSARPCWIEQLLSLLSTPENFKTDQKALIEVFPYSQSHICRTFKSLIGKTITDYFNEQKMKYAYSMLTSSSYSIEQICEQLNINNVSYFYRLFKKQFNTSPRAISKKNLHN